MIRSMTAFARREATGEWGALVWELRSVNHRYLEVSLRLPEDFRGLEAQLRDKANVRLGRGKVDATLRYKLNDLMATEIVVNHDLVNALVKATHQVEELMNNPARISAMAVLSWPGATLQPEQDMTPMISAALALFDEAMDELVESRQGEGGRIKEMIESRCRQMQEIVASVRTRRPQVLAALREKLLGRLADLDIESDNNRLEQELVLLAQKLDVDEELDRLDSHLKEVGSVLEREEPVGRRLDFLMQEFNREANTLGSKSSDIETTQAAVDIKVLIEQMREQVQNIE